jgi:hypothetical protein
MAGFSQADRAAPGTGGVARGSSYVRAAMTHGRTARRRLSALLTLVLALAAGACGVSAHRFPPQHTPSARLRLAGGRVSHIAVIVLENEEYGQIIGSSQTPFLNALADRYGLASQSFAITHPSLPNYLALTGGSTFGVSSDCTGCSVRGGGLAGQLAGAGISWAAYMEDLPRPCFLAAGAGEYAKKHDPFAYYSTVASDPARCDRIVPLQRLFAAERAGSLPRFAWITPNLCHDMHDCAPAIGDRFLSGLVPALLRALGPRGLLIITFDEGTTDDGCCRLAAGGHVATILAGGLVRPHSRLSVPVDHYSVLQAIEDLLDLPRLGGAACACTPSLAPLLKGSSPRH